jgi:hypothetical protein
MSRRFWLLVLLFLLMGSGLMLAQGTLSQQVLQLLTRVNTWTALQTFNAAIAFNSTIPSDTTLKVYSDGVNLFFNGSALSGGGSVTTPHNLLSTTHPDTLPATVTRGAWLTGNSTPAWAAQTVCAAGAVIGSNGTDMACTTDASGLTALNAAQLTGTIAAISGVNLTALNASSLSTGTVPLARLSGITNSQIDASAAIARSKLNLAAGITLTTDVTGLLPVANGGTNLGASADDNVMVGNGTTWQTKAVPDCDASTSALNYDVTTNAFSCRTLSLGTGTVTSVALSLPAIFSVSGSPVTVSGTLTASLASQLQNLVWASPNGSGGAPTFRALVNADLPTSGVAAGTYASVTVNTRGVVTAATSTVNVSSQVTGIGTVPNGMTGLGTIGDDNILLGSGATTFAAASIPNCVTASCWGLGYTQATNTFAAITSRTVLAPQWLDAGFCQNATPVLLWSTPTANPGVAACVTGSNTQKLVVDFADGANTLSIQREFRLPTDWTGAIDATFKWYTTATSGAVVWQIQVACVADSATGDPSFNTASTIASTALGTTNQYNTASVTGITTTGCSAGNVLYVRVFRDPTNGSDTLAATARLIGVDLILRRAI